MPDTITMSQAQIGARLRSDAKGAPKAVLNAMFSAAQRGKAYMIKNSPVDRGILRNAWKVIKLSNEVQLVNDQPYAGVMELGARPFKISSEGIWTLKAWVMRRLKSGQMFSEGVHTKVSWAKGWNKSLRTAKGQSLITGKRVRVLVSGDQLEKEAESIAWAIAKTFEKVGIRGKRFVWKNLPQLAELMDGEVKRYLGNFFNRPVSGKT